MTTSAPPAKTGQSKSATRDAAPGPTVPFTAALDIGGTGLKAMLLDGLGRPASERLREPTPRPATVDACLPILVELVRRLGPADRIGVGFPGVVEQGRIRTAANLHRSWLGVDLERDLQTLTQRPVRVCNDADVQGLGVIAGQGVEVVITLGTGVGSGLYLDGRLVPNLELGHHPFRKGESYEEQLGDAALERVGKKKWNKRVLRAVAEIDHLFNFQHLYLGGGNARKIAGPLPERVQVVDNLAGLLGAFCLWEPTAIGKRPASAPQ